MMMCRHRLAVVALIGIAIIGTNPIQHVQGFVSPTRSNRKSAVDFSTSKTDTRPRVPICDFYATNHRQHKHHNLDKSTKLYVQKQQEKEQNNNDDPDPIPFRAEGTSVLIGGQAAIAAVALALGKWLGIPNNGLGSGIDFSFSSIWQGCVQAWPLILFAIVLDLVEPYSEALQDITKASNRAVLGLIGGTFRPGLALIVCTLFGVGAGVGEELMFRGVMQYQFMESISSDTGIMAFFGIFLGKSSTILFSLPGALSLIFTSIIFGSLHAVTPLYAIVASIASLYFGWLYLSTGNLAIPMAAHSIYDVGALLWCHWQVTNLSPKEQMDTLRWEPGENEEETQQ